MLVAGDLYLTVVFAQLLYLYQLTKFLKKCNVNLDNLCAEKLQFSLGYILVASCSS